MVLHRTAQLAVWIMLAIYVCSGKAEASGFTLLYSPLAGQAGAPEVALVRGQLLLGSDATAGLAHAGTIFSLTLSATSTACCVSDRS